MNDALEGKLFKPPAEYESEALKGMQSDLLVPQYYPDSTLFKESLEKLSLEEQDVKMRLNENKATFHAIAPYLRIIQKKYRSAQTKPAPTKVPKSHLKKAFAEFISDTSDASDLFELIVAVHETADALKSLLMASNVVSYFADPSKNELYQSPRHVASTTSQLTRKIELGTTMAAHAAFTKEAVISDNVSAESRFPEGLGQPGSITKFAMCVPIKLPDGNNTVVAVFEVTRDVFSNPFNNRDLQVMLLVTGWMGYAILENKQYNLLCRKNELCKYLIYVTNFFHSGHADIDKTLSDLIIFARDTVGAERGCLYVVDKVTKTTIIVDEYDQISEKTISKRQNKKVIEQDRTPLSTVMFSKKIVNKHYRYSSITSELDQPGSLRSYLCVPILDDGYILGALQVTNKKQSPEFSKEDEDILLLFGVHCTTNLLYLKVCDRSNKANYTTSMHQEMLFYHLNPCSHDRQEIKETMEDLPTNFFSFGWYPAPVYMPRLAELTLSIFHKVMGDAFMKSNNIVTFVLTVKKCYRHNPYHNFLHAFCVVHTMGIILTRCPQYFSAMESAALLIAALCHDIDHRGFTNNFLQLSDHYLSRLYESSSIENHHFAITKMVLYKCKMFKNLKTISYNELLKDIYECILATDLANYYTSRDELLEAGRQQNFTFKNPDHRRLIKNFMMVACDYSGLTKPLVISKKITESMYEEFYLQGDMEKNLKLSPTPMFDRGMNDMVAENQLQLLGVVVLPCLETLQCVLNCVKPMVDECYMLLRQWQELVKIKNLSIWKPEESIPKSRSSLDLI